MVLRRWRLGVRAVHRISVPLLCIGLTACQAEQLDQAGFELSEEEGREVLSEGEMPVEAPPPIGYRPPVSPEDFSPSGVALLRALAHDGQSSVSVVAGRVGFRSVMEGNGRNLSEFELSAPEVICGAPISVIRAIGGGTDVISDSDPAMRDGNRYVIVLQVYEGIGFVGDRRLVGMATGEGTVDFAGNVVSAAELSELCR